MRLLVALFLIEALVTLQVCMGQQKSYFPKCYPKCPANGHYTEQGPWNGYDTVGSAYKVPEPYVQRKPGWGLLCFVFIPSCLIDWVYYAASADDRRRRQEEWEALKRKLGDARRKREASLKDHVASILVSKLRRQGN